MTTEEEKKEKKGFFRRLWSGLSKTRSSIVSGLESVFTSSSKIDEDFYEDLEEILIMGDLGVSATDEILDKLRTEVKEKHIKEPAECRDILIQGIRDQMTVDEHAYDFEEGPSVVLVIGVNGVGKSTSIGKLAGTYQARGKKVLIAAADTFRAAAVDQLKVWADRAGVDLITGAEGADPASVVFDALQAAKARHTDILLVDTAGRLHNKKNLMAELAKIDRVITREYPDCIRENLVVLDGTTGQNALSQAREFAGVTNLTGIILTKMDGTAKGGIAVAVQSELKIPVKFIGVGEQIDDLQRFEPDAFVDALFDVRREEEPEEEDLTEEPEEKETPEEEPSESTPEEPEKKAEDAEPEKKNWWDDIDDTPIFREHGDYY
jgi:fused signal recognition particle receptor